MNILMILFCFAGAHSRTKPVDFTLPSQSDRFLRRSLSASTSLLISPPSTAASFGKEVVIPCTLLDVHKATVLDPTMVRMRAKVNEAGPIVSMPQACPIDERMGGEVTKNTPAVAWFPTTSCAEAPQSHRPIEINRIQ